MLKPKKTAAGKTNRLRVKERSINLIVYPVIFEIWREWEMTRAVQRA